MRVSYISACLDASGYAEAARNHIAALAKVGVQVDVQPVSFEGFKSDLGKLGHLITSMVNEQQNDIQILHLTPQNYRGYLHKGKYNIGYCAWESDRLPDKWVGLINELDEVWVPCRHNQEVFMSSGIKIPIEVMPHPMNHEYVETVDIESSLLSNKGENDYMFYSIFQWTERKNPLSLLKAYLTGFKSTDNVVLVLKTYLTNPSNHTEVQKIKQLIRDVKARLYMDDYPRILLVSSLLSRGQIQALHEHGDCFISLHRAEGFGLPIMEAMMAGNPVITTQYGGPMDFVDNYVGRPVNYRLTPCYGMPWKHYPGYMNWADPDVLNARKYMQELYNDRELSKKLGEAGRERVLQDYSWDKIGKKMADRLEAIKENM